MKDKVIETVGKTWRALGELGEADAADIAKRIKEKEAVVNFAVGWLAREDKIRFLSKRNKILFALVASELQAFKNMHSNISSAPTSSSTRRRRLRLF
ncbi:MAG TPA: winged helix-turn-helix domain-containing protein [Candidatus Omnitrophota bacterium]|nr:winged helix-turn-helix domain-containing protein [Candidatus Omnitrophota bacterium]